MHKLMIRSMIVCLLQLVWQVQALAEVVVIVHPDNPLQSMSSRDVSDLYLGRTRSFGGTEQVAASSATIYEYPDASPLRARFFHSLNGMGVKQVNAYWARLRFSGEELPPAILPDSRSVHEAVSRDRNAIGYVDSAVVNSSVKVVLRLKE